MAEKSIELSNFTLVRYNNPTLCIKHENAKGEKEEMPKTPKDLKRSASEIVGDSLNEIEEILNFILPPRCWEENGQHWTQTVSSAPATRQDVIKLQEMLDKSLTEFQTSETGICPNRSELYRQVFDEIVRQVTISCTESGLLLTRVRDDSNRRHEAYKTLYCSTVAYGLKKSLQAQEDIDQLQQRIIQLEKENSLLEATINDMRLKADQDERQKLELQKYEDRERAAEIDSLKTTKLQYKAQLEGMVAKK